MKTHKTIWMILFFFLGFSLIAINACEDENEDLNDKVPVISTTEVTEITATSAKSGGNVIDDRGSVVTSKGVVWGKSENPSVESMDGITSDGTGSGSFISNLSGLDPETTYYVRAYAINGNGTGYGPQVNFTTSLSGDNTQVVEVINPATGKVWMDRNLGASRAATSSTDGDAYGDLYQWGRGPDGHQIKNSETTYTPSISDTPGHGKFIVVKDQLQYAPYDWRIPQNDNLWQGVNGINNPCPNGFRLPSRIEWEEERASWSSDNAAGAFSSPLKLPMAGERNGFSDGMLQDFDNVGSYWSSTVLNESSRHLSFSGNGVYSISNARVWGFSVRCIKDLGPNIYTLFLPISPAASGQVSGGGTYAEGSLITITATPGENFKFVNWTGDINLLDNPNSATANLTMPGYDVGITANFETISPYNLELQVSPANGGQVSGAGAYYEGTEIEISATPNEGYQFAYWTGDTELLNNPNSATATLTMPGYDVSLTANFISSGGTQVVEVLNPATGKIWIDRNQGASRAATASNDAEAYGDLYQWGRAADGHQLRTSPTTSTLSNSDNPGHGNFILAPTPYDWRSPQNNNLWQGVNGINNPCPAGYRLPTIAELDVERMSWSTNNAAGAFNSPLKLPVGGGRKYDGSLYLVGSSGHYWSSTVGGIIARGLLFISSDASTASYGRAYGGSVRCLKD